MRFRSRRDEDEDEDEERERERGPAPQPQAAAAPEHRLPPDQERILELQRTVGNQAVSRMLAAPVAGLVPGLQPEDEEQREVVGGVGDLLGEVGSMVGNAVGAVAGALTGISIDSKTNTGPTHMDNGGFDWRVGFSTTGKSGWIVQEVNNEYDVKKDDGAAVGGAKPTPKYYEAWAVSDEGAVTPIVGSDNDYWIRPNKGPKTKGHWSMSATCYFTTTDPSDKLTKGGVKDAGILLSGTDRPSDLGIGRLHRYAHGAWDSTLDPEEKHKGGARP